MGYYHSLTKICVKCSLLEKENRLKRLAIAFTGQSNSGKTTLIEKIAKILIGAGHKVCIVKHDPKDKARFDVEGKDSYRFSQTGADVAVISPTRTTIFKQQTSHINEIVAMFGEFDYLLVEGLKWLPLPRICVVRDSINEDYFDCSDVLAIDDSVNILSQEIQTLDLNNPHMIIDWINKNGKKV